MGDMLSGPLQVAEDARARTTPEVPAEPDPTAALAPEFSDEEILELWSQIKKETVDTQWVFHRQWQRNIWYVLGRQWIEYQQRYGGWRDKRMAAWIPRPVTNKCKETVQAIRAMFTSISLSVNIRPNGADPHSVAAAATADELSVLLHDVHHMNQVMSEFDFWLCATGNAFLHTFLDYDVKNGVTVITAETCQGCGQTTSSDQLTGAQPTCPDCGGTAFQQAVDPTTGAPIQTSQAKGVPTTICLSPLEFCFNNAHTRFDDIPYGVRARWRTKRYYESQPSMKDMVPTIVWAKSPSDHSLALFTGLAQMNDLGMTSGYGLDGSGRGNSDTDGAAEYEVWMKPCADYPDGLVFRIIEADKPVVVRLEDEALPGPLPYVDAKGMPIFPFAHATYEHVGGRILGSGPLDVIIQKQDQLNQLDSHTLLCLSRTANPVWLEPKGAEIQKITGMPGLVIKWNPLTVQGNAKPERIPGIPIDSSIMSLREQYLRDIEELAGTFDILKGMKPAGVEAFSALQLLVERSQARFSSVFQSRGEAYKNWVRFALELERAFGPEERTKAINTPNRGWTFKTFKKADLAGDVAVVVEDGSTTPKTSLGMRAAVEHANSLGALNMSDPDQQYTLLKLFGLTKMVPTLDIHMQSALQKQDAFEKWVTNKQLVKATLDLANQQQQLYVQEVALTQKQMTSQQLAGTTDPSSPLPAPLPMPAPPPSPLDTTPLKWLPWYNPQIHLQEFLKWANDDGVRDLMVQYPIVEELLKMHMQEITAAMPQPTEQGPLVADPQSAGPVPAPPQGAAMAMQNSNRNSASIHHGTQSPQPQMPPGKQSPHK